MAQEIKFGTDGWRGIIADDFTFDNVRRVAGAIASYVSEIRRPERGVVVGYDTRFASPTVRTNGRGGDRGSGNSSEAGQRLHARRPRFPML